MAAARLLWIEPDRCRGAGRSGADLRLQVQSNHPENWSEVCTFSKNTLPPECCPRRREHCEPKACEETQCERSKYLRRRNKSCGLRTGLRDQSRGSRERRWNKRVVGRLRGRREAHL